MNIMVSQMAKPKKERCYSPGIGPQGPKETIDHPGTTADTCITFGATVPIKMKLDQNGFMTLELEGEQASRELDELMDDFGTRNLNVVIGMLLQIQKFALSDDGTVNPRTLQMLLAMVRDEQPRTARDRRLALLNAALHIVALHRAWENCGHTTFLDQDQASQNGLRHCMNAVAQGHDLVQPRASAPAVENKIAIQVNEAPRKGATLNGAKRHIEHKPHITVPLVDDVVCDPPNDRRRRRVNVHRPDHSKDPLGIGPAQSGKPNYE
jgi:hypothetical protein